MGRLLDALHQTSFYPWITKQFINGAEMCTDVDNPRDNSELMDVPLNCENPQKNDIDDMRLYDGCPQGWYHTDNKFGVCKPRESYQGPCKTIHRSVSGSTTEAKLISDRCRVLFPLEEENKSVPPHPDEQDFGLPCPKGWTFENRYCYAPETYAGPCPFIQNFRGMRAEEKQVISKLCQAPWPLRVIQVQNVIWTKPCPEHWTYNEENKTCHADPYPGYHATKSCPSTIRAFPAPKKSKDFFAEFQTPLSVNSKVSLNTMSKLKYARACHVNWPALPPQELPPPEDQAPPVPFTTRLPKGGHQGEVNKNWVCLPGYKVLPITNPDEPMCEKLPTTLNGCDFQMPAVEEGMYQDLLDRTHTCRTIDPKNFSWTEKAPLLDGHPIGPPRIVQVMEKSLM